MDPAHAFLHDLTRWGPNEQLRYTSPIPPALAAVISRVRLDREITHEEAYNAGLHHIEQTLNLRQNAVYSWRGSVINPKRPGWSIFNYSDKA